MAAEGLFGGSVSLLDNALTVRVKKHSVVASNIANIDTPNYKAFDIVVQEEMKKLGGKKTSVGFKKTHHAHLPARGEDMRIVPTLLEPVENGIRKDKNTVDLDKSMADMAENTILYTALAQIVAKRFEGMKAVINEGK